jgi:hypothetical protein
MSNRWEYEVAELPQNMWGVVDPKKLKEQFNLLGRQGWELVGFNHNVMTGKPVAVFKRTTP